MTYPASKKTARELFLKRQLADLARGETGLEPSQRGNGSQTETSIERFHRKQQILNDRMRTLRAYRDQGCPDLGKAGASEEKFWTALRRAEHRRGFVQGLSTAGVLLLVPVIARYIFRGRES